MLFFNRAIDIIGKQKLLKKNLFKPCEIWCSFSDVVVWVLFNIHRLFGVTSLTQTNCSSTWMIIKNQELHWYHHANPILLLVMYYTLATLIRLWLQEPIVRVTSFSFLALITNDYETSQCRYLLREVQIFRKIKGNRQQVQAGTLNLIFFYKCLWELYLAGVIWIFLKSAELFM